jgi:hypothetical protein
VKVYVSGTARMRAAREIENTIFLFFESDDILLFVLRPDTNHSFEYENMVEQVSEDRFEKWICDTACKYY